MSETLTVPRPTLLPTESLPALLATRATAQPDRVVLREVAGATRTYAELDLEVRRWMHHLAGEGVGEGDFVATQLPTGIAGLAVWMAVARLGAVEVPINTAHLGEVLVGVVEDSGARVVVVADRWRERFDESAELRAHDLVVLGEEPGTEAVEPGTGLLPAEHDIATVVFTSGTTGRSKGVLLPWRQLRESARWCIPLDEAGPEDHWYVPLPMFHVSGKLSTYAAVLTGAEVIFREVFSTSSFWTDVRRFGTTTALLPGSAARYLESQPAGPDDAENPLRNVFVAPFPIDRDAFAARFGIRLTTAFNMTELSCPIVSGWELGPEGSCGRPRPGVECRIVDEHDREVPVGEVGELVVRTVEPWETMAGYLGAPEATQRAWRNLWFHTGDRCRRDEEGYFFFVDRAGDAIRRRGENISSAEVESALIAHPDIEEAAVVGVPSEWGEHDVMAFVIPRVGATLTAEEVSAFAQEHLPRFMVPRFTVVVDDLPRTQTQRVQKARLRDWSGPEPVHDLGR